MVKLNRNLENILPYWGAQLEQLVAKLKEEGKDIIPLGIGDPDLPTPQPIVEAKIKELKERYYGYPTSKGRKDLRETLARYYGQRFGVGLSPDNFTIAMGAKNDLFDISRVFSNPGETVLIPEPAYPPYVNGATIDGCKIVYLPCTKENNFEPELSLIKGLEKVAILYLCNPNNPTGTTLKRSTLMRFAELAREYGFLILHDIAYSDFVPGGKPFVPNPVTPSIFELPGADEVALEVGSFSKPFSMTGIRLSWAVSKGEINETWTRYRTNRDSGVSEYFQRGGLVAFSPETFEIVERNMEIYGQRAKILESGFREMGLECNPITNTPYAWVKCPEGFSSESFIEKMLNEAHVVLTAGNNFGPSGEGYFRATIFQPKERLEKAIQRMKQVI